MSEDLRLIPRTRHKKPENRPERNGIVHPGVVGRCAAAWSLFYMLQSANQLEEGPQLWEYADELGLTKDGLLWELPRFLQYHA